MFNSAQIEQHLIRDIYQHEFSASSSSTSSAMEEDPMDSVHNQETETLLLTTTGVAQSPSSQANVAPRVPALANICQHQRQIFDVPLSTQRYQFIQAFLQENPDIESVTEFGCGNGRIVNWLKSVETLSLINFVDVDTVMLEMELFNHFQPTLCEMLFGRRNSTRRLDIKVYNADLTIPNPLLIADCFIMVEVIEHLLLEHVEQSVKTIFGHYKPKYVVITTPNSEFNHLLRKEGEPVDKFRHSDHKFEWTRAEFAYWADRVCQNFPYSVRFDGVGTLFGSEPYGPCTQIAIFTRLPGHESKGSLDSFCLALDKLNVDSGVASEQDDQFHSDRGGKPPFKLMTEFTLPGRTVSLDPAPNKDTTPFSWTD